MAGNGIDHGGDISSSGALPSIATLPSQSTDGIIRIVDDSAQQRLDRSSMSRGQSAPEATRSQSMRIDPNAVATVPPQQAPVRIRSLSRLTDIKTRLETERKSLYGKVTTPHMGPPVQFDSSNPFKHQQQSSKRLLDSEMHDIESLQASLFPRDWEIVGDLKEPEYAVIEATAPTDATTEEPYRFTIMNFNVLADGLSGYYSKDPSKLFIRVPHDILNWEFRGPRIVAEILRWSPDIVTMQECDQFPYLQRELCRFGYNGEWQVKDWSPNWKLYKGSKSLDGVAVFYKQDKFELQGRRHTSQRKHLQRVVEGLYDSYTTYFGSLSEEEKEEKGMWISPEKHTTVGYALAHDHIPDFFSPDGTHIHMDQVAAQVKRDDGPRIIEFVREDLGAVDGVDIVTRKRFMTWIQDNPTPVAIALRLRPTDINVRPGQKDFAICATHLHSGKDLDGEFRRRRELVALLNDETMQSVFENAHPFIGCDLNAAPLPTKGYPPLAYRYMVGTGVPTDDTYDRTDPVPCVPGAFKSACRTDAGELPFSTWKHRKKKGKEIQDKHTIDYIFYPPGGPFRVTKILGMPDEELVETERREISAEREMEALPSALPCAKYPSDHFAVMAEFIFEEQPEVNPASLLSQDSLIGGYGDTPM